MVEDREEDAGLVDHILRKDGMNFTLRRVETREEFIKELDVFEPDTILSDHSLPQFDSVDALNICRQSGKNIPFILVTGTVSEEFAVNTLKQGADDYILKSNLIRLPSAIKSAIQQHRLREEKQKEEEKIRQQNEQLIKILKNCYTSDCVIIIIIRN